MLENPLNKPIKLINITGYLFAWDTQMEQPMLLEADDTEDLFLPVFSNQDNLDKFCSEHCSEAVYRVISIDNPKEIIGSLPYWFDDEVRLRVMVDPRQDESGTFRFSEILREECQSTAIH